MNGEEFNQEFYDYAIEQYWEALRGFTSASRDIKEIKEAYLIQSSGPVIHQTILGSRAIARLFGRMPIQPPDLPTQKLKAKQDPRRQEAIGDRLVYQADVNMWHGVLARLEKAREQLQQQS
jgi:hypothetical protein